MRRNKEHLRQQKLALEIEALQDKLSPRQLRWERIRIASALGGVVTAIVGIIAFTWTIWQGLEQLEQQRQAQSEERLQIAITRLQSSTSNERYIGVIALQQFLTPSHRVHHRQVLLTLASQLAADLDQTVREAIVDVFGGIDAAIVAKPDISAGLELMTSRSRLLIAENDLRQLTLTDGPWELPEDKSSHLAVAQSVGHGIAKLVGKNSGFKDLSEIYCVRCNFSGGQLSDAIFDGAVLSLANFRRADLRQASFRDAVLEGTEFISADLSSADLSGRSTMGSSGFFGLASLFDRDVRDEFYALTRTTYGPLFNCAILTDAVFHHRTLLAFLPEEDYGPVLVDWRSNAEPGWLASFTHADLTGADFRYAAAIGLFKSAEPEQEEEDAKSDAAQQEEADEDDTPIPVLEVSYSTFSGWPLAVAASATRKLPGPPEGFSFFELDFGNESKLSEAAPGFANSFRYLEKSFAGSNWEQATLPAALRDFLAAPDTLTKLDGGSYQRYPGILFDDSCRGQAPRRQQ